MSEGPASRFTLSHVSLTLLGLMWVLPFLYHLHTYPLPSFYQEAIAAALGLVALALLSRDKYWQAPQIPGIALVPMALAGLLVFQLALGMPAYPEQGLLALLYLLFFLFLLALGRVLREEIGLERLVAGLAWFLLAGAVLSAQISLLQYYNVQGIWDDFIADRMVGMYAGNLGQANHFANYTALGLASLLYLSATARLGAAITALLAAMLLYVLGLSGSRSAWLYLGGYAALAGVLYAQRRDAASRRLLLASALLLPLFGLAQLLATLAWLTPEVPQVTATWRLYELASGLGIRLKLWHEAWEMFLSAPLLGVGLGQFGWQHFQGAAEVREPAMQVLYHNAHNLLLQLMAEMGIVAALVVLAGVAAWLWRFTRAAELDLSRWWMLAVLAVLAIHSLLEFPLWYIYFIGIAAVLLGAGESGVLRLSLGRIGRLAFAGMLVLGAATIYNLAADYNRLRDTLRMSGAALDPDVGARELNRGLLEIHRGSLLAPYVELLYSRSAELDAGALDDKLVLSGQAMRFLPLPEVAYRHAIFLALAGQQEAALAQLQKAFAAYGGYLPGALRELERLSRRDPARFERLLEFARQHVKEPGSGIHPE